MAQQRLIERVRIVFLAADGVLNSEISPLVGIGRLQVGLWPRRWQPSQQAMLTVDLNEPRVEPIALTLAMRPGDVNRIKFAYKRHGI